jgi:hypothetical protein
MAATVTMVLSWANSPTTTTSEQVNYPSYTPYTYETQSTSEYTSQEIGGQPLPLFAILMWVIAIAVVVLLLTYALYWSKRKGEVTQTKLDAVLIQKPPITSEKETPSTSPKIEAPAPPRESTMFCNQCGSKITRDSKFGFNCM